MIARKGVPVWLRNAVCASLLVSSSLVWAQATTSLRGTVLDPEGVVLQGASITLENSGTGAVRTTSTDDLGSYQFPQVPPGAYRIRAEMAGFKSISLENMQLPVSTPRTLNLQFKEIGSIEVNVFAEPLPLINTVDATTGNQIQNSQIVGLPLEARGVAGLLSLQPGVVYTGIDDKVIPDTRGGAVTGARSDQTNVTLDGVDVNDQQTGEAFKTVLPVTLDSVQEFRLVTSNATANLGRSGGGQISLITRSGTNVFHGSVYEYHRNTVTSANSFFNNSTISSTGKTLERPKLLRNIFGAALGGPIRKNRLFIFLNLEDTITRREEPQLRIVPSLTLRQGVLRYFDTTGAIRTVTDQQLRSMDPLGLGPNPAVLDVFRQYPVGNDPTKGGDSGLNFTGFRFNAPLNEDKPSYIGRIDYTSADHRHDVFVRGALADWKEDDLPAQFPGQAVSRILFTNSKGIVVGHSWSIRPKLVNDFRWGLTFQGLDFTNGNRQSGLQLRGIDNIENFDARNSGRRLPVHNFTNDLTWVNGRHTLQFGVNVRNTHNKRFTEQRSYPFYHSNYGLMENFGADLQPIGIDEDFVTSYVQAQMALLGTISQSDITYFVNRDGTIFPRPHIPRREFINNELEWYVQDQRQLRSNLTLTMGLRYSYFAPPYEKNGLQVRPNLDINEWFAKRRDGAAVGIPSNANPLLSFIPAGKANNAPSFFDPDRNNFAPRFSLAWSPSFVRGPLGVLLGNSGKSSVRLGASLMYDRTGGTFPIVTDLSGAIGLAAFLTTTAGTYNYETAPRFSGLRNLTSIAVPAAPEVGFPATPDFTNTGFMVDTKLRTPYSTTFGVSISRELPARFAVETAYLGRIGKKLLLQNDFAAPLVNFRDPKSGQTWVEASGIIDDLLERKASTSEVPRIPFFENVFAPMADTGSGTSASQGFYNLVSELPVVSWMDVLKALDAPGGATVYGPNTFFQQQFDWLPTWTNLGQSSYHSFQLIVRKRFGDGLQADFNYTLAKSLDNGSSAESEGQGVGQLLNAFAPRQSLSFSDFDVRHQVNSNFVLDIPVGRERRFASNMRPTMEHLLGGWRLAGLLRWRTGFPFGNSSGNGLYPTNFAVNGPPTLKPDIPLPATKVFKDAEGGPNIFADPEKAYASFQHTKSGFSGNRNALHGPGFFTLDTGVQKSFKAGEKGEIQFRWETFNLTNTVSFDGRVYPVGNQGISFDIDAKSSFGQLRTSAGNPRIMQFALRYQF